MPLWPGPWARRGTLRRTSPNGHVELSRLPPDEPRSILRTRRRLHSAPYSFIYGLGPEEGENDPARAPRSPPAPPLDLGELPPGTPSPRSLRGYRVDPPNEPRCFLWAVGPASFLPGLPNPTTSKHGAASRLALALHLSSLSLVPLVPCPLCGGRGSSGRRRLGPSQPPAPESPRVPGTAGRPGRRVPSLAGLLRARDERRWS